MWRDRAAADSRDDRCACSQLARPAGAGSAALQGFERTVIASPGAQPSRRRSEACSSCAHRKAARQLARQERRADVDPGVLVDLAAEELRSVGALLPDDLRALDEARVVDEQRAAFAGDDVLRLVKAEAPPGGRCRRAAGPRSAASSACAASSMTTQVVPWRRSRGSRPCRSRRRRSARRRSPWCAA